jgi:predicted acylesterase/phospholipase RssA
MPRALSSPRTTFLLSSGASLGAPQVGMLRALYEQGITAELLVGTSALNVAFVASRPQTAATARELGRVWCALQREHVSPVSMRALVGGLCGKRDRGGRSHRGSPGRPSLSSAARRLLLCAQGVSREPARTPPANRLGRAAR